MIIDLTEERSPLLTDGYGHFVTHSPQVSENSNIERIFSKRLEPFSPEHIELFKKYLPSFAGEISKIADGIPVVIHRAFFAGTHFSHNNECLKEFYDLLARNLPQSISIEVPKEMRVSSVMHKWGPYALHMGDEYYKYLLHLISRKLDITIHIKNGFSIQNIEKSIFFLDSQIYCKHLKEMYGEICSNKWLSQMQYTYIIERELEKREIDIQNR